MMQTTMQIDADFELISWNIDVGGLGDAVIEKISMMKTLMQIDVD